MVKLEHYIILDTIAKNLADENHILYVIEKDKFVYYRDIHNMFKDEHSNITYIPSSVNYCDHERKRPYEGFIWDDKTISYLIHNRLISSQINPSKVNINHIFERLKEICSCHLADFDDVRDVISCRNGFYNRRTKVFEEKHPNYLALQNYDVEYDKDVKELPENFAKFLWSITENEDGTHNLDEHERILKIMKCELLGWIGKNKQFIVCYGLTNSGKGVLDRVVQSIVGLESYQAISVNLLGERFEIAYCKHKRILTDTDCNGIYIKPDAFSEIKRLTGLDAKREEEKCGEVTTSLNEEQVIKLLTNRMFHFPAGEDLDAVLGRMVVEIYKKTFDPRTSDLDEAAIQAERSQIFSYLINCVDNEQVFSQLPTWVSIPIAQWYRLEAEPLYKIIHTSEDILLAESTEYNAAEFLGEDVRNYLQDRLNAMKVSFDLFNQDKWKYALTLLRDAKTKVRTTRSHGENITLISNIYFTSLNEYEKDSKTPVVDVKAIPKQQQLSE